MRARMPVEGLALLRVPLTTTPSLEGALRANFGPFGAVEAWYILWVRAA